MPGSRLVVGSVEKDRERKTMQTESEKTFMVTRRWIEAHKTKSGGWKARQLKQIGIDWPPVKGWIDEAVGRRITEDERVIFELFAGE